MRRIYLASSWRNARQPEVLLALKRAGHQVYDFRFPAPGVRGFAWSEIDHEWESWTTAQYIAALQHPIAQRGHQRDQNAMQWADTCVLLLPSGRSAHIVVRHQALVHCPRCGFAVPRGPHLDLYTGMPCKEST